MKPGFYQDIPFADYLADKALNSSGIKIFTQSPAKFKYWSKNQKPATITQLEGSALHCLILTPKLFAHNFGKSAAPRVGSVGREKWDKTNPTARALTEASWVKVHQMAEAFKHTSCTIAHDLLSGGTSELSIWFDDPDTGTRCKIRPDYLRDDDIIIDIKTTQSGSPQGFLHEVKRWGYHYQVAFYMRGLNAAYRAAGVNRQAEGFIFIAVENFPPYSVGVYTLNESLLEEADKQIGGTLVEYKKCVETNTWHGYPNEIIVLY